MADRHRRSSRRIHEEEGGLNEHHDDVERNHRPVRREPEHHVIHEGERHFSRTRAHEDHLRDRDTESLRSIARPYEEEHLEARGHHHHHHGSRAEYEPTGDSELRRRQTREHLGGAPSRRLRQERNDVVHEVRSESPLPPDPAPVDFPIERSPPQNGQHGHEEHDARLRSALYPLENTNHRDRPSRHRAEETGYLGEEAGYRREDGGHRREDAGHGREDSVLRREDSGFRREDTGHRREDTGHRREDTGHRREDSVFRREDAGFRREDSGHRREDSLLRREDAGHRREDSVFRREDVGHRREESVLRREDAGYRGEDAGHRDEDAGHRGEEPGYRGEETGHRAEEAGHRSRMHPSEGISRGSQMNMVPGETLAHPSRSRQAEPHQGSKLLSGSRIHSRESGTRKSKTDELRQRSGEGRFSSKKIHSYSVLKEEEEEGRNVERHDSVLLPVLEDYEKTFHELVADGDIEGVKAFLQEHSDFNINCVNYQKISALHVAVKQQNEEMVEFLLQQKDLDISDCALYAIKAGNIKIVEMILDEIRLQSPRLEYAGPTHSADFSDDMTPIILAAQLGNYEMINFLIKRGHSIPPVHPPFCKCEACRNELKKYDRLRYSTMKLNLYKAICNPMYIFQTTDDPFQRAFELVRELQDAAIVFPQFKVSFEELWQGLRKFATDLIGCCRNAEEVEIVLKKCPANVSHHGKLPRLQYAIDLKQKEFVSHPYTQAVLGDAWTGDLLEWKIRSPLMQSLAVIPRIPMLPIMTVMCIFLPTRGIVKKWKTPVNKMISSAASYLVFLVILFLESNIDKTNQKRGPPNSGLEGVIIIYVIGYIWLNIRICFKQGIRRFFTTMWHWYDTIMLFLFTMTIVFWIASWVDITASGDVDLPRKYWNAMDPELIAEGFFAAAVIMAFFRLNLFLSLNYHLGPLQVSIGKMTLDIFRFIIIFSVIILAWCAGLCRFYQPYDGMVQKDAATGSTTTQVSSFVSFQMTLKTLFWAIFGMSPYESADVVIENLPGDTPDTTIINKHQFTEIVGYIAFATYQFLSVVVVLNMLVACMANTFTKVIDNVTVEWVFGRSQIYLSFMASSILPPPFNLVPTISGIKDVLNWFQLLFKPTGGQRAKCSFSHCCYIESETEAYVSTEFPALMSELAQRYIHRQSEMEAEEATNELEEVKNDLIEIKETLRKLCVIHKC